MSTLFDLSGKVAVVTGAGRGLGQGLALGLAEAGADLALVVNRTAPEETVRAIESLGRKAVVVQADLSTEAGAAKASDAALEAFGKIDILVNNAGIIRRTPAADHSYGDWQEVLDVNLNSVFLLSQSLGREMLKQGSGKIINIASMLTFQGGINVPGYTASKHAVAGLTKALANEWAGRGINVNAIAPGYMSTDNTEALRNDETRSRQILERIPAGRWGTAQDMKGPVVFLASSASDYMSGHVLCVDGGWMTR
jgi:2-deoxy-D-gluconate 3-dehydrogenase